MRGFNSEDGIALIIVLWIIALLSIMASEFIFAMKVETYAVRNFKNEARAHFLALSGINLALMEIRSDYKFVYINKDGVLVFVTEEDGTLKERDAKREFAMEGGGVSYVIIDENSKININVIKRDVLINLLRVTGVQSTERDVIVDSILDWRDKNHEFHLNGAEDDYYLALNNPYEARDGFMDTVEELLLVKGVTPVIFYGMEDLPPEFAVLSGAEKEKFEGIGRFLTVSGGGMININTAGETVLEAVLGKGRAMEVMVRRDVEDFFTMPRYGGTVNSGTFTIYSKGEVGGVQSGIKVIVKRKGETKDVKISYWSET